MNKKINQIIFNVDGKAFFPHLLNRLYSIVCLLFSDYDLFIPTNFNPYFQRFIKKNKPYVLTVHDMIDELYPFQTDYYERIVNYKKRCIENASMIIAISDKTKSDILRFYPQVENKIAVVKHGYSPKVTNFSIKNRIDKYGSYILFVGKRDGYKNFEFMIKNLHEFLKNNNINLCCIGGGDWTNDEKSLIEKLDLVQKTFQISAPEDEICQYYCNALFFIYPSEYEGFGLPILEAFSNDCPILLSNSSCFPEIAGDAASYFELNNSTDFKDKVELMFKNVDKREELKKKGREMLLEYSIEKCIQETFNVYKQALDKSKK
ncbi:MAG: glycosyltransferase family 4 protein [Candidatus Sericytochromatia bacterium]